MKSSPASGVRKCPDIPFCHDGHQGINIPRSPCSTDLNMQNNLHQQALQSQTRRHFFRDCGVGVGAIALSDLLNGSTSAAAATTSSNPLQPKATQLLARAK